MAITLVQSKYVGTGASQGGINVSLTNPVTAGNTLVFAFGNLNKNSITGVSDNLNGTWTGPVAASNSYIDCTLWVLANTLAGTITVNGANSPVSTNQAVLCEFTGTQTTTPVVDQFHTSAGSSATPACGPTPATTRVQELVCAYFQGNANVVWGATAPGILITPTTSVNYAFSYYIAAATGAQTANMTASAAVVFDSVIATIFPGPLTPTTPTTPKGYVSVRSTSQS